MQQVLLALRFFGTRTFQRVTGNLFVCFFSVFAACTGIHKVSRAIAKQKEQLLSYPKNLADSKRKLLSCCKHFTFLIFFFTFHFTFHFLSRSPLFTTMKVMVFFRLEFQPPPASLKLNEVTFDTVGFLELFSRLCLFLQRFPFIASAFHFWNVSTQFGQ